MGSPGTRFSTPWLLDELRDQECAVAALSEAVSVRFGDFDEPAGIPVETELVLERARSSEPIEIERIPVEVTATRCDAHGLAGSQKTFVFSVWVAVGDAPAVYLEVVPDADLQSAMGATIDACIRGDR